MHIIIINGAPMSGKDTFVQIVLKLMGKQCWNYSTVDFVKDIAKQCGWGGLKDLPSREFLSNLKDLLSNAPWGNVIHEKVREFIEDKQTELKHNLTVTNSDFSLIFIHSREPQDIKQLVDKFGAKTLVVRRTEAEAQQVSNHADANVLDYVYDYEIDNNGTLDDLEFQAVAFLTKEFNLRW